MSPEPNNKIEVFYNKDKICIIDSDSPSLSEIVNKVILRDIVDYNLIKCETNIDNFDTGGFEEVLINTIKSIKGQLKSNIDSYSKVISTICCDQSVEQFYDTISKNK